MANYYSTIASANANTAFFVGASSEFEAVAYNENWVAVWSGTATIS